MRLVFLLQKELIIKVLMGLIMILKTETFFKRPKLGLVTVTKN